MALNTFGGMLLPLLALPAVVQHVQAAGTATPQPAAGTAEQGDRDQDGQQAAASTAAPGTAAALQGNPATMLQQAVAAAGLVQAAAAFCATLSAGMQRRHLYAWALFAPRFSFAAVKLAITDWALLLLSLLV